MKPLSTPERGGTAMPGSRLTRKRSQRRECTRRGGLGAVFLGPPAVTASVVPHRTPLTNVRGSVGAAARLPLARLALPERTPPRIECDRAPTNSACCRDGSSGVVRHDRHPRDSKFARHTPCNQASPSRAKAALSPRHEHASAWRERRAAANRDASITPGSPRRPALGERGRVHSAAAASLALRRVRAACRRKDTATPVGCGHDPPSRMRSREVERRNRRK